MNLVKTELPGWEDLKISEGVINMRNNLLQKNICLVMILSVMIAAFASSAFAREERGHKGGGWSRPPASARHEVVHSRGEKYHYYGGKFYKPSWLGFWFSISIPPIGAVVTTLPVGHRTVVVRDLPYYYYEDVYYRPCYGGYVVVDRPVVVSNVGYADKMTVNVPNSNGSFTPVELIRSGNGYIGPQGEYYPANPTVNQLKVLYGR